MPPLRHTATSNEKGTTTTNDGDKGEGASELLWTYTNRTTTVPLNYNMYDSESAYRFRLAVADGEWHSVALLEDNGELVFTVDGNKLRRIADSVVVPSFSLKRFVAARGAAATVSPTPRILFGRRSHHQSPQQQQSKQEEVDSVANGFKVSVI